MGGGQVLSYLAKVYEKKYWQLLCSLAVIIIYSMKMCSSCYLRKPFLNGL